MIKYPNFILSNNLTPTDVKIYFENGLPYIDYIGKCYTDNGFIMKVHIPKISLNISLLENNKEYYESKNNLVVRAECFAHFEQDNFFTFEIIERDMTKKQIEKELGYKVNIVEEKK